MNAELEVLFNNFTVNGVSIPVELLYYEGHGEPYVTYRQYDKDNVYSKGNILPIIKAIKSTLKQAGWTWQPRRDSPDMYEADTGYFHKTICFAYPRQIVDEQDNNQNSNN